MEVNGLYITENLTIKGSNVAANGERVEFDLVIKSRWCKIVYIKIVQLIAGVMDISFELWELSPISEGVRNELYMNTLRRNIDLTDAQGGHYGETLPHALPYFDRDTPDEERTYRLHCVLINENGGTASDFAVSVKIADIGEEV